MVSSGMAWVYDKYSRGHVFLYPIQEQAKTERRGLWADSEPVAPWLWRKALKSKKTHQNGFTSGNF